MTEPGGRAWKQTIFHPFALTSRHAAGTVLQLAVESPLLSGGKTADFAALSAVATFDAKAGEAVVFAVNRSSAEDLTLDASVAGLGNVRLIEAVTYDNKDRTGTPLRTTPRPCCRGRTSVQSSTTAASPLSCRRCPGQ